MLFRQLLKFLKKYFIGRNNQTGVIKSLFINLKDLQGKIHEKYRL